MGDFTNTSSVLRVLYADKPADEIANFVKSLVSIKMILL